MESKAKGVEKVRTVLLSWRGAGKLEFMSRWRERTRVSRACQQVAACRRVDAVLFHNMQTRTMGAVARWRQRQSTNKARRARDDDVGKVAWRYQRFGHQLVGAQACAAFLDKVTVLYLAPAMTRWKERSFFHVVPPHRYSYQSFGRQMVAAQQVANILDRARILGMIWALSTWNEVVFTKSAAGGNTFVVSPSRFVVGQGQGGISDNLSAARREMDHLSSSGGVDYRAAESVAAGGGMSPQQYMSQPLGASNVVDPQDFVLGGGGMSSYGSQGGVVDQVVDPAHYQVFP